MSLADALKDKLGLPGVNRGPVEVETDEGSAQVDLVESDNLGVKVNRIRVQVPDPGSLHQQSEQITRRVRSLGEHLVPVEIEPRLQGGVLRSDPKDMRKGEYFEVGLDGVGATVERYKSLPEGGRDRNPFTLTRDQLDELVDDLVGGLSEEGE